MGFFGFGKKKEKEKEQQSAQAEETRLEAQADETSGAENAQTAAGDAEQAAQDEKKQGLFSRLWQGLSKTRGNVAGRVDELIEATETIDEDFYEDLVDILIMSDMGVRTSDKVIQELKTRVARERITDAKKAREILKEILKEIKSGKADVIIGTHPHVVEPVDVITGESGNKMPIFYSLGNFVSSQKDNFNMLGGMASVTIVKDKDGARVEEYELKPTINVILRDPASGWYDYRPMLLEDYTPELAAQNRFTDCTVEAMQTLYEDIVG